MDGKRTCATCKYFVPLTMMSREERVAFINNCYMLGIDDYDNYGYCEKFKDDIIIKRKSDGEKCKYWEAINDGK